MENLPKFARKKDCQQHWQVAGGTMVDVPDGLDDPSEVIIYGVESEQIEEENDAYKFLARCTC